VLLPGMLFTKGYSFHKGEFIKNIKYTVVFGILGTFMLFFIVTALIYAANLLSNRWPMQIW
jgi:hypothetical protein